MQACITPRGGDSKKFKFSNNTRAEPGNGLGVGDKRGKGPIQGDSDGEDVESSGTDALGSGQVISNPKNQLFEGSLRATNTSVNPQSVAGKGPGPMGKGAKGQPGSVKGMGKAAPAGKPGPPAGVTPGGANLFAPPTPGGPGSNQGPTGGMPMNNNNNAQSGMPMRPGAPGWSSVNPSGGSKSPQEIREMSDKELAEGLLKNDPVLAESYRRRMDLTVLQLNTEVSNLRQMQLEYSKYLTGGDLQPGTNLPQHGVKTMLPSGVPFPDPEQVTRIAGAGMFRGEMGDSQAWNLGAAGNEDPQGIYDPSWVASTAEELAKKGTPLTEAQILELQQIQYEAIGQALQSNQPPGVIGNPGESLPFGTAQNPTIQPLSPRSGYNLPKQPRSPGQSPRDLHFRDAYGTQSVDLSSVYSQNFLRKLEDERRLAEDKGFLFKHGGSARFLDPPSTLVDPGFTAWLREREQQYFEDLSPDQKSGALQGRKFFRNQNRPVFPVTQPREIYPSPRTDQERERVWRKVYTDSEKRAVFGKQKMELGCAEVEDPVFTRDYLDWLGHLENKYEEQNRFRYMPYLPHEVKTEVKERKKVPSTGKLHENKTEVKERKKVPSTGKCRMRLRRKRMRKSSQHW